MIIKVRDSALYSNGVINTYADGTTELLRENVVSQGSTEDKYHTVVNADRIDLIAYQYYKDIVFRAAEYWWLIADVNNIENPLDLSNYIGQQILIPDLLTFKLSQ